MLKLLLFLAALGPMQAYSLELPYWYLELAPWYPRPLEIKPNADYLYRTSKSIASKDRSLYRPLRAHFYNLSALIPVFNLSAQMNFVFAHSSQRAFGLDNFSLTGRYQLMDDSSLTNQLSAVAGATFTFASKAALNDRNSFHHGRFETLWHLSVGKEWPCDQFWRYRSWGNVLLGISDGGSPWWQTLLAFEYNRPEVDSWSFFVSASLGLGGKTLKSRHSFHGYGPIAHRAVHVAVRYSYYFVSGLQLKCEYWQNVYAYNFPRHTNAYCISFSYPFGL